MASLRQPGAVRQRTARRRMLTAVGVLLIHLPSARLTDTGLVHLCSVFSNKSSSLAESAAYEAAVGPCGNTQTHVQVEGMVARSGEKAALVAHSMGNIALSDALELLALQFGPGDTPLPVFDEVVFAAPDCSR